MDTSRACPPQLLRLGPEVLLAQRPGGGCRMKAVPEETAAQHFTRDMLDGCFVLKKLGYWPSYFHREVANIGGVQTVRNLLAKPSTSEGFSTLWSLGRLDLTAEAYVLMPWYADL